MTLADNVVVHRVGGTAVVNLRLKPVEERLQPPGISLQVGGSPDEAADRIRAVYRTSRKWAAPMDVGTATIGAIRAVGFDVIADPTPNFPFHARLIPPHGVAGLRAPISCCWRLRSPRRRTANMIATTTAADTLQTVSGLCIGWFVTEELDGEYVRGTFTAGPEFAAVEPLFREFEELVNDQVLSLTDQAMSEIDRLGITVVSPAGHAVEVHDVQLYSDGVASYRVKA